MRTAIILAVVVMIVLAGYLILVKEDVTPEEARKQQVEEAIEETKDALQGASDSLNEAVTVAADAATAMAAEWQSDIEDVFPQANNAVTNLSEQASVALHDAVNTALEDAAVAIAEKSGELETAADAVRQELRRAVDNALVKAAQDIADGSASIEQASKQLRKTIEKKAAQIE